MQGDCEDLMGLLRARRTPSLKSTCVQVQLTTRTRYVAKNMSLTWSTRCLVHSYARTRFHVCLSSLRSFGSPKCVHVRHVRQEMPRLAASPSRLEQSQHDELSQAPTIRLITRTQFLAITKTHLTVITAALAAILSNNSSNTNPRFPKPPSSSSNPSAIRALYGLRTREADLLSAH